MARYWILLAVCAALAPRGAQAGGFRGLARELAGAARSARIERVAVVPFVPSDGSSPQEGLGISERLLTQIVRTGRVRAVERSLFEKLMQEHYLGATGALDSSGLKRLGSVLAVDGIVTGSFARIGGHALIRARLIDAETGAILAAAERKIDREGMGEGAPAQDFGEDSWNAWDVRVPQLSVTPPPLGSAPLPGLESGRSWGNAGAEQSDLRDSPASMDCRDAGARVDALERRILDIKARYWALKLKEGLVAGSLRHNPGSTITDPFLKKEFYASMKRWFDQKEVPDLTPAEARLFSALDRAAFSLHQECGL